MTISLITQLMDTQRVDLAAILVGSDAEARYLLDSFSNYTQKFHDMTDEEFSIHRTRWNIMNISDVKGLEFSSVFVLTGRMSANEKYIACTRALDELFVYSETLDVTGYEKKPRKTSETKEMHDNAEEPGKDIPKQQTSEQKKSKHVVILNNKTHSNSQVRSFFEECGFEVVDKRDEGGRLWVVGEKTEIREFVNVAIAKFGISGKYATGKEIKHKNGWCTKTDK